jgi:hypothetical protein
VAAEAALITVGVPTFNRAQAAVRLARYLVEATDEGLIEAVIIDDGSCDGTVEALDDVGDVDGLRILANRTNLGYARTFLRLFEKCRTEYLLVTADDDLLDLGAIPSLWAWLQEERPDLASTQWRRGTGELYRGHRESGPLDPRDFRAFAGHAPGLVYRVDACRSALAVLRDLLDDGSEIAITYPQLVVTVAMAASGADCRWWAGVVVREGDAFESQVVDSQGLPYWDMSSRVRQHVSLAQLLESLGPAGEQMLEQHHRELYPMIRLSMEKSIEEGGRIFDESAAAFLRRPSLPRRLRARVRR